MKKIILIILVIVSNNIFGQDQAELNYIKGLDPAARVQFLETSPNWIYQHDNGTDGLIYSSQYWTGRDNFKYAVFKKFLKDDDGDKYGDPDNYIALINNNSGIYTTSEYNYYTTNGDLRIFNIPLYNPTTNEVIRNYRLHLTYASYNGDNYLRYEYPGGPTLSTSNSPTSIFDCDDSNINLPTRFEIRYLDYDGDGHAGLHYSYHGVPSGCSTGGFTTIDDCNDYDVTIINSINWYRDFDGDGYGDINEIESACHKPIGYVRNADDCNDTNSDFNISKIWYADLDEDGYGDENNTIFIACPPVNYIRNCEFDSCPSVAGIRTNGCPLVDYDFNNDTQNYLYTRTYLEAFEPNELLTVNQDDVLEQITYVDGLGRKKQKNNIRFSPLGKDIIEHTEYDGNGIQNKQYLPYVSTTSLGMYDNSALTNTVNYYNTPEFENTTNPYLENITDDSPLLKAKEVALPGEDWKAENGHTLKKEEQPFYALDEVRKYIVSLNSINGIAEPSITYDCDQEYYQDNTLIKTIVKDQNWSNTQTNLKDNTRAVFTDKYGRTVLERKFNNQAATPNHDTYYVYEETTGNLMYVLPPKAVDILEGGTGKKPVYSFQKQVPWTEIAEVDKKLAEEYQKTLKEVKEVNTKESTLLNKYGGSGFVDILVDTDNELTVNFNISLAEPMPLKTGMIAEIKSEKPIKDQTLGEIFSIDYHYKVYIQKNALFIEGSGKVSNINVSFSTNSLVTVCDLDPEVLANLTYQYKYDYKDRLVEKKLPGKGWEYILYNKLNQAVLSQNAIQRVANEWSFVKYDYLGRVAYTGLAKSAYARPALQIQINQNNSIEEQTQTSTTIGNSTLYYTSNTSYSESGEEEILTVNYYEEYIDIPTTVGAPPNDVNGTPISTYTKELPTVSKTKVLDTNDWISKVVYYDNKARPIYAVDNNAYLGTNDKVEIETDFTGKILHTKLEHTKSGLPTYNINNTFEYDRVGRVLKLTESINNQPIEVLFENQYSELGRLTSQGIGNTDGQSRYQNVDYTYNILGLLKGVNDVSNLGTDLFAYELSYNDPNNTTTQKMYNGNISEVSWKSARDVNATKTYEYQYDPLNRIKSAHYTNTVNQDEDFSLTDIAYDKNGNIYSLERTGSISATAFDIIDDLAYTYENNSNKLLKVKDNAGLEGFKDGKNSDNDYTYDLDGKLIQDNNKGISQIKYNYLGQPKAVYFYDPDKGTQIGKIEYIYSATGKKIEKRVIRGENVNTLTNITQYNNRFNYTYRIENGAYYQPKLLFIKHAQGYINEPSPNNFQYVYQFKDHLGNIRLSYTDLDTNGIVDASEILQENDFYPFGLKHQNYSGIIQNHPYQQFNGKELEQAFGLDLYEMDFRLYDQALGRFMVIDPLAEFGGQMSISPYAFAKNNPISLSDPTGLCPECPNADYYSETEEFDVNGVTYVIQGGEWVRDGYDYINETELPLSHKEVMAMEKSDMLYELFYGDEEEQEQDEMGERDWGSFRENAVFKDIGNVLKSKTTAIFALETSAIGAYSDNIYINGTYKQLNGKRGNLNKPFNKLSTWGKTNKLFKEAADNLGKIGNVATVAVVAFDIIDDGNLKTSTALNTGLTVLAIAVPVTAPFVIAYGIADLIFDFSGKIDNNSNGIQIFNYE